MYKLPPDIFKVEFPVTSNKVLAQRYNVSGATVSRWAKLLGITKDPQYLKKIQALRMRGRHHSEVTKKKIAERAKGRPNTQSRVSSKSEKKCIGCGEIKEINQYYKINAKLVDGTISERRMSRCKPCHFQKGYEWRKTHPENVKCLTRKSALKSAYGISPEKYEEMLKAQNHCCAICGSSEKEFKKRLNVDHCHNSKAIRGLLCLSCNNGLGRFKDNPEYLRSAADYIDKHGKFKEDI